MKKHMGLIILAAASSYGAARMVMGHPQTLIMVLVGILSAIGWQLIRHWLRHISELERRHAYRDRERAAKEAYEQAAKPHRQRIGRLLIDYIKKQGEDKR